ncbi:MAG: SCO family protein [Burkholderiales bacterium]|nr:MAG: SCO family protein [Burkholderiales bacterium]
MASGRGAGASARRGIVAGMLALSVAGLIAGCDRGQAPSFHSIDVTGAEYAQDFRMRDHDGNARELGDFRGKVVTVFFGYLNCPDFCPMHLVRQRRVLELLGDDAARVQTLFVTVDPERDRPERLEPYVTAFHPSFIGLWGTQEQTEQMARDFKVFYRKVELKDSAMGYAVDHTTLTMVYDTEGRLRLAVRHELTAEQVAADLRRLLAEGG